MTIANSESTLAAALGVSGTMSARLGLFPITPLTMIWRRQLTPSNTLLSAVTTQAGIALAETTVAVVEGQWVTLDSSGNAIIAPNAAIAPLGPVFSDGSRFDLKGGITILHGPWVAQTSYFDQGGSYSVGTLLEIGTATVQGAASSTGTVTPITLSAVGDIFKVVAAVERPPFATDPATPAGCLQIRRLIL